MRRLMLGIVFLFLLSAGLIAAARAVGRMEPLPPTYLDTGGCEQPCWQGIKPGYSRAPEFFARLNSGSPYGGRVTDTGNEILMFELATFGSLQLADIVREWGPPDQVGCLRFDALSGDPVAMAYLFYADGLIAINAVRDDRILRLSPDMRVRAVQYYAPGEPLYEIGTTAEWQGFASYLVYPVCVQ